MLRTLRCNGKSHKAWRNVLSLSFISGEFSGNKQNEILCTSCHLFCLPFFVNNPSSFSYFQKLIPFIFSFSYYDNYSNCLSSSTTRLRMSLWSETSYLYTLSTAASTKSVLWIKKVLSNYVWNERMFTGLCEIWQNTPRNRQDLNPRGIYPLGEDVSDLQNELLTVMQGQAWLQFNRTKRRHCRGTIPPSQEPCQQPLFHLTQLQWTYSKS